MGPPLRYGLDHGSFGFFPVYLELPLIIISEIPLHTPWIFPRFHSYSFRPLGNETLTSFKGSLTDLPLKLFEESNPSQTLFLIRITWKANRSGSFNVKSAYRVVVGALLRSPDSIWKKI